MDWLCCCVIQQTQKVLLAGKVHMMTPATAPYCEQTVNDLSPPIAFRRAAIAIVCLFGSLTVTAAMVDVRREGYMETQGLLLIAVVSSIPSLFGAFTLLLVRHSATGSFLVWLGGVLVAILPGLAGWILYACLPIPRNHMGAEQMHIFFFPGLHLLCPSGKPA